MKKAEILWLIIILLVTALFLFIFGFMHASATMMGVLWLFIILLATVLFYLERTKEHA